MTVLVLALVLPAAILVAVAAAATARWADRRADRIYASHRAMILALRAALAAWEAEEERRRTREAWASLGRAAQGIVNAFREAAAPIFGAVASIGRAFEEATRPPAAQPRDPRVSVVPKRRR